MAGRQVFYILICSSLSLFSAPELFSMPKPFEDHLCLDEDDMILPEKGTEFLFRRYYNGGTKFHGPLGIGWGFTFGSSLIIDRRQETVTLKDGDGLITVFEKSAENEYRTKSNPDESLSIQPDGKIQRKIKNEGMQIFSADGFLEKIIDPLDHVFQLIYEDKVLSLILTPSGRQVDIETNDLGEIISISEPGGRKVEYQYNDQNELILVKDSSGKETSYAYDGRHNINEIKYPDGSRRGIVYKKDTDQIVELNGPGECSVKYEYFNQKGYRVTFGSGYQVIYQDDLGKRIRIISDNDGIKNILKYDEKDQLIENRDSLGRMSSFEYDDDGRMTKTIDKAGNRIEYIYDTVSRLLLTEKLNNRVMRQYEHDSSGNIISTTDEQGLSIRYTYDKEGLLDTLMDAKGRATFYSYDTFGNVSQIIHAGNIKMLYQHDEYGRLTEETDSYGNKTSCFYDAAGNLAKAVFPGGLALEFTYDMSGNCIKEVRSDGASREFVFENGQLAGKVDWDGSVSKFKYNTAGKIVEEVKPSGSRNTYSYNTAGLLTEAKDALGNAMHFSYDSADRLIKKIYPNGMEMEFSYDTGDRLIGKKTTPGRMISWAYHPEEFFNEVVSGENGSISHYDSAGRLISLEDKASGLKAGFDYDARGNISVIEYPGGESLIFFYDDLNRPLSIKNKAGQGIEYQYSESGIDYKIFYSDGILEEYHFDSLGYLKDFLASLKGKAMFGFTLTRNIFGAVTEKQFLSGTDQKFEYDKSGRLSKFYQSEKIWEKYEYDRNGNILSVERPRGKTLFSYDAADHLISDGTFKYQYDVNGNLSKKAWNDTSVAFTFDEENQLSKIVSSSGNACSFSYDPAGRRNTAETNGQKESYFYVNENRAVDFDAEGQIKRMYFYHLEKHRPIFFKEGSGTYFFHYDERGNVMALTNDKGEMVNQYIYSPFGNALVKKESVKNPFQFMGREYDGTFGLYFDGERFYDPAMMRFLSADFIQNESLNMYADNNHADKLYISEVSALFQAPDVSGDSTQTLATLHTADYRKGKFIENRYHAGDEVAIQDWEYERQIKNQRVERNTEDNLNDLESFVKSRIEASQMHLKSGINLSNIRELMRENLKSGRGPLNDLLETHAGRVQREQLEREAAYKHYEEEQEKINSERRKKEEEFGKNVLPQIQGLIGKAQALESNAQAISGKVQGAVQTIKGIETQVSSVVSSAQGLSGKVDHVNSLLQAARISTAAIQELNVDKGNVIDIYAKVQNASQWACNTNDSIQASSQASSAETAAHRAKSMTAHALEVCSSMRSQLIQIHDVKKQAEAVQAEAKNTKVQFGKLGGLLESAKATLNAVQNTKAEIQSVLADMESAKNDARGILSPYSALLKAQTLLIQINALGSKLNADNIDALIQEGTAVIARIEAEIQEASHAQGIIIPEFNMDFGALDSKVEDICASADTMDTYQSKINAEVLKSRGCANHLSQVSVYSVPVKKNIPNPPSGWSPVGESVAGPVNPSNDAQSAARQSADEQINGNDSSTGMNSSQPGQTQQPSSGMPQPPQKPNGPNGPKGPGYQ